MNFVHTIQHHLSSSFGLSIGSNIYIAVFLERFICPIFASLEDQFGSVGFGAPNVTQFGLQGGQGNWFGKSIASKDFDKWHDFLGVLGLLTMFGSCVVMFWDC